MENLKICVNSEADQTEARNIMISLGYLPKEITCISGGDLGFVVNAYNENGATYKEITLPGLRDLVVLKRNSIDDATHTDSTTHKRKGYLTCDGVEYFWSYGDFSWKEIKIHTFESTGMKPIEKEEMKEYLRKNSNGTYSYIGPVHTDHVHDFMIEIPEWAVAYADHKNGHGFFYDSFCKIASFYNIVWSRHTHPEELPFVDDEPKIETATGYQLDVVGSNTYGSRSRYDGESDISYRQYLMNFIVGNRTESLNDQYAEIEKVRQSAWQKQEGGNHYKNLKIQPMQYALENKLDYAQANVVKYVTRHKEKNGKEDLLKAIHNLELMIEFYYGDEK